MNMLSTTALTADVSQVANPIIEDDFDFASISSASLLMYVSISSWAGKIEAKRVSEEVSQQHNAEDGVTQTFKKLFGKRDKHLFAIQQHITATRTLFKKSTLPWSDNGQRLVTTKAYFNLMKEMTGMRDKFWELVEEFLVEYNNKIIDMQARMGSLFNIDEYPTVDELRKYYGFKLEDTPLMPVGDWRLDINADALQSAKDRYAKMYSDKVEAAMLDIWKRLYEPLANMSERLDYEDTGEMEEYYTKPTAANPAGVLRTRKKGVKIFGGNLVSNITDMVDVLRVSNVTNSPRMNDMADRLENALLGVTVESLREDEQQRKQAKADIDAAIAALPTLDI